MSATDEEDEGPEPAGGWRLPRGRRAPNDELPLGRTTSRVARLRFDGAHQAIVALHALATHLICKVRSKQGLTETLLSLHLNGELSGFNLFHPAAVQYVPKSAGDVVKYARAHFQCTATRAPPSPS